MPMWVEGALCSLRTTAKTTVQMPGPVSHVFQHLGPHSDSGLDSVPALLFYRGQSTRGQVTVLVGMAGLVILTRFLQDRA